MKQHRMPRTLAARRKYNGLTVSIMLYLAKLLILLLTRLTGAIRKRLDSDSAISPDSLWQWQVRREFLFVGEEIGTETETLVTNTSGT